MHFRFKVLAAGVVTLTALATISLVGQGHDHAGHAGAAAATRPTEAGQSAFAAIKEILTLLEQDPATDWSKVDLDALREHLIDMNRVLIDAKVVKAEIPGGAEFQVSGQGDAIGAIHRMVESHGRMIGGTGDLIVQSSRTPAGVTLRVTAGAAGDARAEQRIRALGFAGYLALGDHHQPHHELIARGRGAEAHRH